MSMLYRVAIPPRTTNGAIDRLTGSRWRIWLATPDFIHGTYLVLYSNGAVERVTVREDEGDEVMIVKDGEI